MNADLIYRRMTILTPVAERVANGVAWLDANKAGWVEQIDPARLDIASCVACVLGQVFGHYDNAPGDARWNRIHLGFDRDGGDYDCLDLDAEWRRVIEERRAEAP